jgi:hypothetical protein
MQHRCAFLGLIVAIALAACSGPTQLYVAHNTVVGLDAAVDTNRQAGRLIIGYDRQFVALAPRSVPHVRDPENPDPVCDRPGEDCREAMAVLSCNEVEVEGIFLTRFKDRLATGTAAKNAASEIVAQLKAETVEPRVAGALFDCWRSAGPADGGN